MLARPNAHAAYVGVLSEVLVERSQGDRRLIVESGILGGDLIPRAYLEPTIRRLRAQLDGIAAGTEDHVQAKIVGSSRFGAENRAVFGDIDLILRMKKIETLQAIQAWAADEGQNLRDIANKTHGSDVDLKKLGHQFSFLFPIYREGNETLTIGELRAILQSRHGQTNWKEHHDERLKVQSNLGNLAKKSGTAMVQVDVMHSLVDGMEMSSLVTKAKSLAKRINAMKLDNKAELSEWLEKAVGGKAASDFEHHYEFLRTHAETQNDDDQKMLAAVYYLKDRDGHKAHLNGRWSNLDYRYQFHPDSLQLIYFLAAQVGIPVSHDDFTRETLQKVVERCIAAGITSDKLTIDMLHQPKEAFQTIKGKFKEAALKHLVKETKNKRADEHNPDALWKNLGTREVKRI